MKQPIEGHSGLYKDTETGVIENNSDVDRQRYRLAKHQASMNLSTQSEVAHLRKEIDEIKSLLRQILSSK